ncbi:MAG TPA: DNA-directed RNA polymerase subunit omega [Bacillota bacterium]|nr:DNA-directed RNA polymerase subunit omega [Bacillota bacterium]HPZ21658.1 DNA-directed RNA polymerase subunit omega [Bacillota bacterium]HQD19496.1 DNA-directed RNA polymerase subunit omega [Bacillota bacterium]
MLKPSIDSLLEKVDSKFTMVIVAARRARNIQASGRGLKSGEKKPVTMALDEILNSELEYERTKNSEIK